MSDVLSADHWPPYSPALVYFPDSDCFEFVTEDVTVIYDEVIPGVYWLRDIDGRELKGFKIEGTLIRFLLAGHHPLTLTEK